MILFIGIDIHKKSPLTSQKGEADYVLVQSPQIRKKKPLPDNCS